MPGNSALPSPYIWERHSFSGRSIPKSRVARSFLLMVPWLSFMVLGLLFFCLTRQTLVQSGHVVELTAGRADEGLLMRTPAAIVRRLEAPNRRGVTVLLLDDGRYASDNDMEMRALSKARPGEELNLLLDKHLPYEDVQHWIERLKACGVKRLNLVVSEDDLLPEFRTP